MNSQRSDFGGAKTQECLQIKGETTTEDSENNQRLRWTYYHLALSPC